MVVASCATSGQPGRVLRPTTLRLAVLVVAGLVVAGCGPDDADVPEGGRCRWHTERLAEPDFESAGRVFLVTSRDRDDSFNFEAAVVDGNVAVFVSLNSRENDRALLDQLLAIAVAKAKAADLGS